jgi:hypothetical protein
VPPTPAWRRYAETIVLSWRASIDDPTIAQLGLQRSHCHLKVIDFVSHALALRGQASTLSTPGTNRSLERSADPISSE